MVLEDEKFRHARLIRALGIFQGGIRVGISRGAIQLNSTLASKRSNRSVEFQLSYRGELKGNGDPAHKHAIRRAFHAQLAELWRQPPLVNRPDLAAIAPAAGKMTLSVERLPYRFVPLVSTRLHATADLDIVLLRPGPPGHILRGGGDIDNRLKTLLDALKMPEVNALPAGAVPGAGEDPFYCLLEDDKLVTGIRVEADRFLDAANEKEVLLLIRVITKYTEAIWANLGL